MLPPDVTNIFDDSGDDEPDPDRRPNESKEHQNVNSLKFAAICGAIAAISIVSIFTWEKTLPIRIQHTEKMLWLGADTFFEVDLESARQLDIQLHDGIRYLEQQERANAERVRQELQATIEKFYPAVDGDEHGSSASEDRRAENVTIP